MGTDDGTYEIDEKAIAAAETAATLVWRGGPPPPDEPGAPFTVTGDRCVIDWSATSVEIATIDESGRLLRRRIG